MWIGLRLATGAAALGAVGVGGLGCAVDSGDASRSSDGAGGAPASFAVPRTPWGHPDLQGTWQNNFDIGVPIEKPDEVEFIATQEEYEEVADQRGGATGAGPAWWYEGKPSIEGRTHLLVDPPDGKLPPLTAWAEEQAEIVRRRREARPEGAMSYRDMGVATRCLTRGVPGSMVPGYFMYNNGYEIVQTPGSVVIRYEMIHDVRIIPVDGRPPLGPDIQMWMGSARGRWEGDTLVVETTNLNDDTPLLGSRLSVPGVNAETRVIERFTRTEPDKIVYEITMEDPRVFTRPWTLGLWLDRDDEYQIFEYACHEGNRGVENILKAALAEMETSR